MRTVRKIVRDIECQDEYARSSELYGDPAQGKAAGTEFAHSGKQERVAETTIRSGPDRWLGERRARDSGA